MTLGRLKNLLCRFLCDRSDRERSRVGGLQRAPLGQVVELWLEDS